ncbi:MAG: hypothetical protein FWC83_02505, partial [Alphaproteobacteria bacterium]|nr:hypothetical protein [Alphaproteobacteria bacterium]
MLFKKKEEKKPFRPFMKLFGLLFSVGLLAGAAAGVYVLVAFLKMPSLDSMLHETRAPSIVFIDRDGFEIRRAN